MSDTYSNVNVLDMSGTSFKSKVVHDLMDWSLYYEKNRIKASKLARIAQKMEVLKRRRMWLSRLLYGD